ncbi:MAG: hypothetical protein WAK95_17830 [Desulfobacterales bacterium]
MGAFVDRQVRCIIRFDRKQTAGGAFPIGNSFLFDTGNGRFISIGDMKIEPPRPRKNSVKTWLICNHLATPEKFISNYLKNRYFVVFDSHVFCHDCNENNMLGGEAAFLKMEKDAAALTDRELQGRVFDPFRQLNLSCDGRTNSRRKSARRLRSWSVCSHLASEESFRQHVFDGNLILFAENNVTCPECLDLIAKGPLRRDDKKMVSMPDENFQNAIFDTLCALNYELSMEQGFIGKPY